MERKGFLICLEGLDGCGKTTQAKLLVRSLKASHNAFYTAEPSKGKIGRFIKEYCLDTKKRGSSIVEALLFAADRFDHVNSEIMPALQSGKLVVSDRYVYSSFAYQGAAGLDLKWIRMINEHAMKPDLAVLIDVDPGTVIHRLKPKRSVMESLETQRRVRKVYMDFVDSKELARVDGQASQRRVSDHILALVLKFLEKSR